MARYEIYDDGVASFWDITLSGRTYTVRWGRVPSRGQSQGDPRGELLALQVAQKKKANDPTGFVMLKKAIDAHYAAHEAALLGPVYPARHLSSSSGTSASFAPHASRTTRRTKMIRR